MRGKHVALFIFVATVICALLTVIYRFGKVNPGPVFGLWSAIMAGYFIGAVMQDVFKERIQRNNERKRQESSENR